jgi:hypothetical protein
MAALLAEFLSRNKRRAALDANRGGFYQRRCRHWQSKAAASAKTLPGNHFSSTFGAVFVCHFTLPAFRTRRRR